MSNGHLLRKSGLAIKKSPAKARNVRKLIPKPPTPQGLRKKLAAKGAKHDAPKGRRFEPNNETESDHQPLITRRMASGKLPAATMPPENREDAQIEIQPQGAQSEEEATAANVTEIRDKQGGTRSTGNAEKKQGPKRRKFHLRRYKRVSKF